MCEFIQKFHSSSECVCVIEWCCLLEQLNPFSSQPFSKDASSDAAKVESDFRKDTTARLFVGRVDDLQIKRGLTADLTD